MASRTKLLTELSVADLWKAVKDPEQVSHPEGRAGGQALEVRHHVASNVHCVDEEVPIFDANVHMSSK